MPTPRPPAASGAFYPADPGHLREQVQLLLQGWAGAPRRAGGLLAPHGGYALCGSVLGAAFASVEVPATVVVLAPEHATPSGAPDRASLLLAPYRTPLAVVEPDRALGEALLEAASGLVTEDDAPHRAEHGVEVLLPFVQLRNPAARLLPLVVGWRTWEPTLRLAQALLRAMDHAGRAPEDVLVVASSDMNHFESAGVTADKDALALDRVIALDAEGLLLATEEHRISMCGRVPAACAMEVVRRSGRVAGDVVGYAHSGTVTGDLTHVVGYAAALLGIA